MPSETERAIERVRNLNVHQPFGRYELCDVFVLLTEHDRLKGELDRLTTRRDVSERDVEMEKI